MTTLHIERQMDEEYGALVGAPDGDDVSHSQFMAELRAREENARAFRDDHWETLALLGFCRANGPQLAGADDLDTLYHLCNHVAAAEDDLTIEAAGKALYAFVAIAQGGTWGKLERMIRAAAWQYESYHGQPGACQGEPVMIDGIPFLCVGHNSTHLFYCGWDQAGHLWHASRYDDWRDDGTRVERWHTYQRDSVGYIGHY